MPLCVFFVAIVNARHQRSTFVVRFSKAVVDGENLWAHNEVGVENRGAFSRLVLKADFGELSASACPLAEIQIVNSRLARRAESGGLDD